MHFLTDLDRLVALGLEYDHHLLSEVAVVY